MRKTRLEKGRGTREECRQKKVLHCSADEVEATVQAFVDSGGDAEAFVRASAEVTMVHSGQVAGVHGAASY